MLPCSQTCSLSLRGNGVCSRLIQLSSAERLRYFISVFDSPDCLERQIYFDHFDTIIYKILNVCPFDYIVFAVSGRAGIP